MGLNIDPVTLAVIQNGLIQVCNEMDLSFQRAAFSPVISEAFDRSDGIYHRDNGELIAQGDLGLPIFMGTMQYGTRAVIERAKDVRPGDVFIANDPYLGGTHLMDVRFYRPFFYRGELFCWLANTGHWRDTGGAVPGGFSAQATDVEMEGLRLPPVKLIKEGKTDDEILSIVLSNIRTADQTIGDIKAQAAALSIGDKRLTALLDRYGRDTVEASIVELKRRAAQQMRAKIAQIPDGTYRGHAALDSDGIVNEPLNIEIELKIEGSEMHVDLSRSSPPCMGPLNSVIATTRSAIYIAMKHIFPDVPLNAGTFEPIHIKDPDGTFLYAKYPRPVSGCAAEVSQRLCEAVFVTLAQVIPDKLFAAPAGTSGNFALGGHDPVKNRNYVMYIFSGGGYGGWHSGDGISNGCSTIGISKTQPLEVMEQFYPVLFEEYSLREGSGGAGKNRGGFGVNYRVRLRRGHAIASFVMDHGREGPQGVQGGADGGPNDVTVRRKGQADYRLPHFSKDQGLHMREGDLVLVGTPGGGGFGRAKERDPERVRADVALGYYSAEDAAAKFGVAVDKAGTAVDSAKTAALRAKMA
ncbi:MAG: methylhydantoinase [Alphaproteobacteria bacterium]|nr:methylhydantoinase [Alphaproteobacteria bacterium]